MTTKKHRKNTKQTRKNKQHKPLYHLKILHKHYPLYASKIYEGSSILSYNAHQERIHKDKCLKQNSSWFGDLDVAKSYKTKNTHIYRWKTKMVTNLLLITKSNEPFLDNIFQNNKVKLIPAFRFTKEQLKNIQVQHPYLHMSTNKKALFEFKFCFGLISVKEQYLFMKFLEYIIENKIVNITRRDGKSIIHKLKIKINYYKTFHLFQKNQLNRLSFYTFDKHAIMNLCKIVYENKLNISGVYQKNTKSFWFPDLKIYKMNIQEYILFNPHHVLEYDKQIE